MLNVKFVEADICSAKNIVKNLVIPFFKNDIKPYFYIKNIKLNDEINDLNSEVFDNFVSYLIDKGFVDDEEKVKGESRKITTKEFDPYSLNADVNECIGNMLDTKAINDFILNELNKKDVIILNISLFSGEYFQNEFNPFMELYNLLLKLGYKCCLYSTYIYPDCIASELYDSYCQKYNIREKVKIYRSNGSVIYFNDNECVLIKDLLKFKK